MVLFFPEKSQMQNSAWMPDVQAEVFRVLFQIGPSHSCQLTVQQSSILSFCAAYNHSCPNMSPCTFLDTYQFINVGTCLPNCTMSRSRKSQYYRLLSWELQILHTLWFVMTPLSRTQFGTWTFPTANAHHKPQNLRVTSCPCRCAS
jgi:hypothetical protein